MGHRGCTCNKDYRTDGIPLSTLHSAKPLSDAVTFVRQLPGVHGGKEGLKVGRPLT